MIFLFISSAACFVWSLEATTVRGKSFMFLSFQQGKATTKTKSISFPSITAFSIKYALLIGWPFDF